MKTLLLVQFGTKLSYFNFLPLELCEYVALVCIWGDEYVNQGISTFISQYTVQ